MVRIRKMRLADNMIYKNKGPCNKNEFVLKLRNRCQVLKDLNHKAETEITWTSIKKI